MPKQLGLPSRIDDAVELLKIHHPYHESDRVFSIAYNVVCGGQVLEDIEVRRNDRTFLDALGTPSIPDPTTAGDFCRRFDLNAIKALMDAINATRLEVWRAQPESCRSQTAKIDADGTLVSTTGACKEGMDIATTTCGATTRSSFRSRTHVSRSSSRIAQPADPLMKASSRGCQEFCVRGLALRSGF